MNLNLLMKNTHYINNLDDMEVKGFLKGAFKNIRPSIDGDCLIGEKNGLLKIIKTYEYGDFDEECPGVICTCLCNCGNLINVHYQYFSETSHCGCLNNLSSGELNVYLTLTENNIPFETQKTFNTCRFPETNHILYFDFYINNSFIVECDGSQHYTFSKGFHGTKDKFKKEQRKDKYKTSGVKKIIFLLSVFHTGNMEK